MFSLLWNCKLWVLLCSKKVEYKWNNRISHYSRWIPTHIPFSSFRLQKRQAVVVTKTFCYDIASHSNTQASVELLQVSGLSEENNCTPLPCPLWLIKSLIYLSYNARYICERWEEGETPSKSCQEGINMPKIVKAVSKNK